MPDTTLPETNGQNANDQGDGEGLIPVPIDTLSRGGVSPADGDTVKFTVEGTVDHVDEKEGCAYVKPEKANGKDIPQYSEDESEPTEDQLQQKAEAADKEAYA